MPASEVKSSSTDEVRIKNYRAQLQQKNEMDIREMQARHSDEVQRMMDSYSVQMEDLKRAYDVQISQEAESLEQKLHEIRQGEAERVETENHAALDELTKLRTSNQQRIDEYKKNAEIQLDAMRKQYMASSEDLHEKARKTAKREQEISKA